MTGPAAKVAADLASLLPASDPLAQVARLRLDELARTDQGATVQRITAPDPTTPAMCLGDPTNPPDAHCWLIYGVGYTDNAALIAYAQTAGYGVRTVHAVPDEYREQVALVRAQGVIRPAAGHRDGANDEHRHVWPTLDGQHSADARDVLAGA